MPGATATSASTEPLPMPSSARSTTIRKRRSSSTTTTSISRRATSARRGRTRVLAHFVHVPWPVDWTIAARADAARGARGACSRTTWSRSTRRAGRGTSRRAAQEVTGGDAAATRVTHHPISIDAGEFDAAARRATPSCARRSDRCARPEKLVVRVDRTDPSKNIVRGFHAFGLLLDVHPEWRGRVTMLALLDPSRQAIPEYVEYLAAIERAVARVNARFGGAVDRPAGRGQLPAVGRGVQAVRRPARERGLRRPEPRREGGAARQRARRGACPLGERGRATRSSRMGVTSTRSTSGARPRRCTRRSTMEPAERAPAGRGAPRAGARARRRGLDRRPARRPRGVAT